MRESNLTLERVYAMLAEFLIELKLHEEQDKIAQIVTGSSSTVKHSMYDDYINASKGKASTKGKGKHNDGKSGKSRWRPPCDDYWKPGGCSQGHHCPEYEASKGKKGKEKGSKPKGKSKGKTAPRSLITPRPSQSSPSKGDRSQPKPEARSCMTSDFLFAMMSTKSKPAWRHSTWNGTDYVICTVVEPQKKLPVFRTGKWSLAADRRVSLYGHDAKTMRNFTLHFDTDNQCDSLDRAWFGEMWFPIQKHTYLCPVLVHLRL